MLDPSDQESGGNEELKAPFDEEELAELVRRVWSLLKTLVKQSIRLTELLWVTKDYGQSLCWNQNLLLVSSSSMEINWDC